jgi:hypothetical protein
VVAVICLLFVTILKLSAVDRIQETRSPRWLSAGEDCRFGCRLWHDLSGQWDAPDYREVRVDYGFP